MWKSLSIAKKIYFSIVLIVVGYTASMLFVIVEGQRAQGQLSVVADALFPASQKSQTALSAFEQQTKMYEDAVTVGDKKALESAKEKGDSAIKSLEAIAALPALRAAEAKTVKETTEKLKAYTADAQALYTEMASGKMDQMEKAAALAKQSEELKAKLNGLNQGISKTLQGEISSIKDATKRDQLINGAAFVAVVTASLFMIIVVVGNTIRRIRTTADRLMAMSNGEWDLTMRLDDSHRDELGGLSQCINLFIEKLQDVIRQLAADSRKLADSFSSLNETRLQFANGADEVAMEAGTVATATEEMAATAETIAQSCIHASASSKVALDSAREGSEIVHKTVSGMGQVAVRVQESARSIDSLGARSEQIGEIIGTIEDIADQTNLLALNAAIEAARAGEQGRGFAVVADEVRALAERTTKATKEIGDMIKSIQSETKNAVRAMEEGVREVEQGSSQAETSGKALAAILHQIETVSAQLNQMAMAAEQQTATTLEITGNMQRIHDVVQKNAHDAQESAEATAQLDDLARNLQNVVANFKVA